MDMTTSILDSYLILGQGTFLQQHAKSVVEVMNSYPRRVRTTEVSEVSNGMPRVCATLETIAQVCVVRDLFSSYLHLPACHANHLRVAVGVDGVVIPKGFHRYVPSIPRVYVKRIGSSPA
jgi:hypothetical protein